jgi:hypothetical protein
VKRGLPITGRLNSCDACHLRLVFHSPVKLIYNECQNLPNAKQKKDDPPKYAHSPLFLLFFLWLLKELITSPAPARPQDLFGLLHFESALAFHFSISGFAHDFTSFFFSLAFLVIAFLLLPGLRFLSAISSSAADQDFDILCRPSRPVYVT